MKPLQHLAPLLIALAGCAAVSTRTPAEQSYLDLLRVRFPAPIVATVPSVGAAAAWSRALEFATRYGEPIESTTETLIRNARRERGFGWSFQATKVAAGDSVRIMVRADNPGVGRAEHVATVARMYAAYIETGEMPFPDLWYE